MNCYIRLSAFLEVFPGVCVIKAEGEDGCISAIVPRNIIKQVGQELFVKVAATQLLNKDKYCVQLFSRLPFIDVIKVSGDELKHF